MRSTFSISIVFFLAASVYAQTGLELTKEIEGEWEIDNLNTTKLWEKGRHAEYAEQFGMMPIASPSIRLTDGKIRFALSMDDFDCRFDTLDESTKLLQLVMTIDGIESPIQFTVVDSDSIILHMPASILGPIQVAYARAGGRRKEAAEDDPVFAKLEGKWQLQESSTQTMWENNLNKDTLRNFAEDGARILADAKSIEFNSSVLKFGDGSSVAWKPISETENSIILGDAHGQPSIMVNFIDKGIIQFSHARRNIYAIYVRDQSVQPTGESYPANQLAESFLRSYETQKPPQRRDGVTEPIAVDGNVQIDEIRVERTRVSGAAVGADISNMKLSLFINQKKTHYGGGRDYLVRIDRLDEVIDNTGKLLSTRNRIGRIERLKHFVRANSTKGTNSGMGPVISMTLENPSIGATELKRIAGEVTVAQFDTKEVRFEYAASLTGTLLKNPLLKNMEIRPRIEGGEFANFALQLTPDTEAKLSYWHLESSTGQRFQPTSMGGGRDGEINKGYSEPIPDDATLVLGIAKTHSAKSSRFEFKDIAIE